MSNAMTNMSSQIPMRAVPGYSSRTEGIQIAVQTNADATDEDLQFFQQLGVEWTMVGVRNQRDHSADFYKHLVKRFGEFGLKIYRIANLGVHNVPEITLNLPGRDTKIAEFKQFIRNLSAAGIKYNTYAHMANGIWTTGRAVGRGGMDARMLDIADAKGYIKVRPTYQTEDHDEVYAVGIAAQVSVPWHTSNPVGIPKTGFPTEQMAHTAAKNIAHQIRGEEPTEHKEFGDIKAVCVMDAGNNGVIILADKMLPPRKHGVLIPGPQAHAMKLAFEKYFMWKVKHGYVNLP